MKTSTNERLKGFSVKQWILFGIAFVIALLTFLALAFNVYTIDAVLAETSGNGFDLLSSAPAVLEDCYGYLGFECWAHLILSIVGIVLVLLSVFKFEKSKANRIIMVVIVVDIILSVLYMVNGIVSVSTAEEYSKYYQCSTVAYVPLILVAIFSVGYFVCKAFIPDGGAVRETQKKANAINSDISSADKIMKYKELLDCGAITQEDFDKKKAELLN